MEKSRLRFFKNQQLGFTLIELMVTISIAGILLSIASNSYNELRENTRVETAKEHIVSVLQQARLKTLSSGAAQTIEIKAATDIVIDAAGREKVFASDNVNIEKFVCGSCTASDPTSYSITFTRRGTADTNNIKVSSPGSDREFIIMVNGITGRVDVRTKCVSNVCVE